METNKSRALAALVFAAVLVLSVIPASFAEETGADALELDPELEQEILEVGSASDADETEALEELEEDAELNEDELAKSAGMGTEERSQYMAAKGNVGEKQYVYNMQLRQRLVVAGITTDAIIKHIEKKGLDTAELKDIQARIKRLEDSLSPEEMTGEEFLSRMQEAKELTMQFREKVHGLVPEDEIDSLNGEISKEKARIENRERIENAEKEEERARNVYNEKQVNKALNALNKEAAAMKNNNTKLLGLVERLRAMHQLKDQFLGKNASRENAQQFREQWKAMIETYKEERFETKLKNERSELADEAKTIIDAIKEAKKSGMDTKDLESQLVNIKQGIKSLDSGKIKENELEAKASVVKNQLKNLGEEERIKERVREIKEEKEKNPEDKGTEAASKTQGRTEAGSSDDESSDMPSDEENTSSEEDKSGSTPADSGSKGGASR